jgi:hypothetical protein
MSLLINKSNGENITSAVTVLKETYRSLNTLFQEMDRIAEDVGFTSLTPKFLRWKSDSDSNGWLTNNFIKLYQVEGNSVNPHLPELRDGDVFGVEVDLDGEEYPQIALTRYTFDYALWTRIPAISDHWVFYNPFRDDNSFEIDESNGIWRSKPYAKSIKKYWGIQRAVSRSIPLLKVSSPDTVRTEIFGELVLLPN